MGINVFISYASESANFVGKLTTELRKREPSIDCWLDQLCIVNGDDIDALLREQILTNCHYFLPIIDGNYIRKMRDDTRNRYILKEFDWASERQDKVGRRFCVPVFIGNTDAEFEKSCPEALAQLNTGRRTKHQIHAPGTDVKHGTKKSAKAIIRELRNLFLQQLPIAFDKSENTSQTQLQVNLMEAVYSYRTIENTISVRELYSKIQHSESSLAEFWRSLEYMYRSRQLPGIFIVGKGKDDYDNGLYIREEHIYLRDSLFRDKKNQIGMKAFDYVTSIHNDILASGKTVYIDSGTTTGAVVDQICRRLSLVACTDSEPDVTIVTNSISHANKLTQCCLPLGKHELKKVKIIIIGGQIGLGTQAISFADDELNACDHNCFTRKYDVGFFGTNSLIATGNPETDGYWTNDLEARVKREAFRNTVHRVIVSDRQKSGVPGCEYRIVTLSGKACDDSNKASETEELSNVLSEGKGLFTLVVDGTCPALEEPGPTDAMSRNDPEYHFINIVKKLKDIEAKFSCKNPSEFARTIVFSAEPEDVCMKTQFEARV